MVIIWYITGSPTRSAPADIPDNNHISQVLQQGPHLLIYQIIIIYHRFSNKVRTC